MKQKLTPWIDGRIKPERVGVYERDYKYGSRGEACYSMWDGKQWGMSSMFVECAFIKPYRSMQQDLPWRGLASDPEKRK